MQKKTPVAILRTKGDILTARDVNNFKIEDAVLKDRAFIDAKMTDLFGFKLVEGSDYRVVECKFIGSDPSAFYNFAFGEVEVNDVGVSENK